MFGEDLANTGGILNKSAIIVVRVQLADSPSPGHFPGHTPFGYVFYFSCKGCQGCQKRPFDAGFAPDTPDGHDNQKKSKMNKNRQPNWKPRRRP
jgi:hypothetical protein